MAWLCWGMDGKQKSFHHKVSSLLSTFSAEANYPVAWGSCSPSSPSCRQQRLKENWGSGSLGSNLVQIHANLTWDKSLCRSARLFPWMRKAAGTDTGTEQSWAAVKFRAFLSSWWQIERWDVKILSRMGWASIHISGTSWEVLPWDGRPPQPVQVLIKPVSTVQVFLCLVSLSIWFKTSAPKGWASWCSALMY